MSPGLPCGYPNVPVCTKDGTARAVGSGVTLPAALVVANSSLIWSEVSYEYKPTVGYVITGTLTLKDQIYMRPRLSDSVARTTSWLEAATGSAATSST